ncbi:MAG: flagellar motor protein MotB [Candidatus Hydrogenedentes bacterium]|nr:flagellar motor protein MotB [Candidatus Hydrogenedentota bacterium]
MAERRKKAEESAGAPAWVVTYGDMMSLLLTFFILLISFSTINEEDFKDAAGSLRGAFGVLPRQLSVVRAGPVPKPGKKQTSEQMENAARELRRRLQVAGKEEDIQVELDEQGGLKIVLPSQVLFDSASAELRPAALPVLNDVATVLGAVPSAFFEVRGHTDSRPLISTRLYRDNHELSFARAMSVTRHFTDVGRVDLAQFEVIACGPSQPVATNGTEEGRQANRRVEIYVRGELSEEETEAMRTQMGTITGVGSTSEGAPSGSAVTEGTGSNGG